MEGQGRDGHEVSDGNGAHSCAAVEAAGPLRVVLLLVGRVVVGEHFVHGLEHFTR